MTRASRPPIPHNLPFLNGLYLAVSAIRDAALVVDGPYCLVQKAELHMAHDPASDLVRADGPGRLLHTDIRFNTSVVPSMALNRSRDIGEVLEGAAQDPRFRLVVVSSMDFNHLLNEPLEQHRRRAQAKGHARVVRVPSESLEADWIDGHSRVLERLAADLDLDPGGPLPGQVAVVGHLMDRREGDCLGNVDEIYRLVRGVGADIASLWLDGRLVTDLARAGRASAVVTLPYGRAAGRILAGRLGVPCVQAPLPVGLRGTGAFVRAVAEALGLRETGETFLDRELTRVVPLVRDRAFRFLHGRQAVIQGDPFLVRGLRDFLDDLGVETVLVDVLGRREHLDGDPVVDGSWVFEAPHDEVPEPEADLRIASTAFPDPLPVPGLLPLGYPNFLRHPTRPEPWLGFEGALWLTDRLVEASQWRDAALVRGFRTPL
ncbi:MAG TPA: nitrogenase component 1 [Myxococcota bacterium]|nr:nitrogenase component 1 [Myxococcota bacterium]HQK51661.1 nitrogenase component 1 [Myxococcota bacterium]